MASGGEPMTAEQAQQAQSAPAIFSVREGRRPHIAQHGINIVLRTDPTEDGYALLAHFRRQYPEEFRSVSFSYDQKLDSIDIYDYFDHKDASMYGAQMLQWVLKEMSKENHQRAMNIHNIATHWKSAHPRLFQQTQQVTKQELRLNGLDHIEDRTLGDVADYLEVLRLTGIEKQPVAHHQDSGTEIQRLTASSQASFYGWIQKSLNSTQPAVTASSLFRGRNIESSSSVARRLSNSTKNAFRTRSHSFQNPETATSTPLKRPKDKGVRHTSSVAARTSDHVSVYNSSIQTQNPINAAVPGTQMALLDPQPIAHGPSLRSSGVAASQPYQSQPAPFYGSWFQQRGDSTNMAMYPGSYGSVQTAILPQLNLDGSAPYYIPQDLVTQQSWMLSTGPPQFFAQIYNQDTQNSGGSNRRGHVYRRTDASVHSARQQDRTTSSSKQTTPKTARRAPKKAFTDDVRALIGDPMPTNQVQSGVTSRPEVDSRLSQQSTESNIGGRSRATSEHSTTLTTKSKDVPDANSSQIPHDTERQDKSKEVTTTSRTAHVVDGSQENLNHKERSFFGRTPRYGTEIGEVHNQSKVTEPQATKASDSVSSVTSGAGIGIPPVQSTVSEVVDQRATKHKPVDADSPLQSHPLQPRFRNESKSKRHAQHVSITSRTSGEDPAFQHRLGGSKYDAAILNEIDPLSLHVAVFKNGDNRTAEEIVRRATGVSQVIHQNSRTGQPYLLVRFINETTASVAKSLISTEIASGNLPYRVSFAYADTFSKLMNRSQHSSHRGSLSVTASESSACAQDDLQKTSAHPIYPVVKHFANNGRPVHHQMHSTASKQPTSSTEDKQVNIGPPALVGGSGETQTSVPATGAGSPGKRLDIGVPQTGIVSSHTGPVQSAQHESSSKSDGKFSSSYHYDGSGRNNPVSQHNVRSYSIATRDHQRATSHRRDHQSSSTDGEASVSECSANRQTMERLVDERQKNVQSQANMSAEQFPTLAEASRILRTKTRSKTIDSQGSAKVDSPQRATSSEDRTRPANCQENTQPVEEKGKGADKSSTESEKEVRIPPSQHPEQAMPQVEVSRESSFELQNEATSSRAGNEVAIHESHERSIDEEIGREDDSVHVSQPSADDEGMKGEISISPYRPASPERSFSEVAQQSTDKTESDELSRARDFVELQSRTDPNAAGSGGKQEDLQNTKTHSTLWDESKPAEPIMTHRKKTKKKCKSVGPLSLNSVHSSASNLHLDPAEKESQAAASPNDDSLKIDQDEGLEGPPYRLDESESQKHENLDLDSSEKPAATEPPHTPTKQRVQPKPGKGKGKGKRSKGKRSSAQVSNRASSNEADISLPAGEDTHLSESSYALKNPGISESMYPPEFDEAGRLMHKISTPLPKGITAYSLSSGLSNLQQRLGCLAIDQEGKDAVFDSLQKLREQMGEKSSQTYFVYDGFKYDELDARQHGATQLEQSQTSPSTTSSTSADSTTHVNVNQATPEEDDDESFVTPTERLLTEWNASASDPVNSAYPSTLSPSTTSAYHPQQERHIKSDNTRLLILAEQAVIASSDNTLAFSSSAEKHVRSGSTALEENIESRPSPFGHFRNQDSDSFPALPLSAPSKVASQHNTIKGWAEVAKQGATGARSFNASNNLVNEQISAMHQRKSMRRRLSRHQGMEWKDIQTRQRPWQLPEGGVVWGK